MKEQHIIIKKTARYYTLGELNAHTKQVWFVLHGFGYLAGNFLSSFEPLAQEGTFMVAPEALNHFYLKGPGGKVGATWMTKEDRMNEIKDYINYLNDLYESFELEQYPHIKITALGFSQGSSTVTRWVNATHHRVDRMISYAGEIAAEVLPLSEASSLKRSQNYFVYGDNDEYFSPEIFNKIMEGAKELNMEVIPYTGKHEIIPAVLKRFF